MLSLDINAYLKRDKQYVNVTLYMKKTRTLYSYSVIACSVH